MKKKLSLDLGFWFDDVMIWICFAVYNDVIDWSNEPISEFKGLLETRLRYESLENLIDFLAFLVPKLWPKKSKYFRNSLGD